VTERIHIVWGPELSPFLLKLESLLAFARVPFRRLPRDGKRRENLETSLLVARATRRGTALRPPANDTLDEFPLVPFLVIPDGRVLYDSSALAGWLDEHHACGPDPLLPTDPALRFVAMLIDEAFDEFGLYMVHHNRWKLAALDNDEPGRRLAHEYSRQLPPGIGGLFARWFARRQVRRLPYLFSVAPAGYREAGLHASLTPPSRAGFPPTHELLEDAWTRYLEALETVLAEQPYLLGESFTLADASAYGQLSMNLTDTAAARRLRELAPRTFDWLVAIRDRDHLLASGPLTLSPALTPLLAIVAETFVPLMRANEEAWRRYHADGATLFNEAGFDAGRSLFDGEMLGRPYRSVTKTFQVRVWRDLRREWEGLAPLACSAVLDVVAGADPDAWFADPPG